MKDLEIRVSTLEQQLAVLAEKVEPTKAADVNAWIDDIHGTFQNDATYRQSARLGREWRKSHRQPASSSSRKTAGK